MGDLDRAIARVKVEIERLQADLSALQRAKKELSHDPGEAGTRGRSGNGPQETAVGAAARILAEEGTSLHVRDILEKMQERGMRKIPTKSSLSSTLIRYSKRGTVFKRADSPNTFDLLFREARPRHVPQGSPVLLTGSAAVGRETASSA